MEMVELCTAEDGSESRRAAWLLHHLADIDLDRLRIMEDWVNGKLETGESSSMHMRLALKLAIEFAKKGKVSGNHFDRALALMAPSHPISVRALAIDLAMETGKDHPELLHEIDLQLPDDEPMSAGLRVKKRRLKKLLANAGSAG